ncbi:hypothetical protein TNCV_4907571 [Trichonephila clavipes]|uniref:Uncharacterized protein n=1 Tax=Trichonephila clavipes TaxID=2585209 RepID=A0A8X6RSL1_TRICX|nr:hypothetical protein TNCV_4907571 [Trichonephila clavipes]
MISFYRGSTGLVIETSIPHSSAELGSRVDVMFRDGMGLGRERIKCILRFQIYHIMNTDCFAIQQSLPTVEAFSLTILCCVFAVKIVICHILKEVYDVESKKHTILLQNGHNYATWWISTP